MNLIGPHMRFNDFHWFLKPRLNLELRLFIWVLMCSVQNSMIPNGFWSRVIKTRHGFCKVVMISVWVPVTSDGHARCLCLRKSGLLARALITCYSPCGF